MNGSLVRRFGAGDEEAGRLEEHLGCQPAEIDGRMVSSGHEQMRRLVETTMRRELQVLDGLLSGFEDRSVSHRRELIASPVARERRAHPRCSYHPRTSCAV